MFLPVTAGSFLVEVIKNFNNIISTPSMYLLSDAIAVIIAGFVTYFSVKYLFKIIKKGKLYYFAYYCFAVSVIGLIVCFCLHYGY